jgi:hypothetical protein
MRGNLRFLNRPEGKWSKLDASTVEMTACTEREKEANKNEP